MAQSNKSVEKNGKTQEPMTTSPNHRRNKDLSSRDLYKHS
jgi:hypothetical protein|tara:strand:- start:762 stop:881 length:120 start_codon:yes stop_codon:yes gene_type:complete